MTIRGFLSLVCLALVVCLSACDDDEEFAPITGEWQGTKAEAEILVFGVPIPIKETDEDFAAMIEFQENGTILLTEGTQTSTGTWEQNGDKLNLSITFSTSFIDLSGTYTIEELTASKLRLFIEKDGTYTDPDSGTDIDGTIKATLYFDRVQ